MIDKKHSSKRSIKLDVSRGLIKLIDSKKYCKGDPDYTTLEIALNKIEAIRKKKKRIEVLTEIRDYYQKELQQKQKELTDKIEYNTALEKSVEE